MSAQKGKDLLIKIDGGDGSPPWPDCARGGSRSTPKQSTSRMRRAPIAGANCWTAPASSARRYRAAACSRMRRRTSWCVPRSSTARAPRFPHGSTLRAPRAPTNRESALRARFRFRAVFPNARHRARRAPRANARYPIARAARRRTGYLRARLAPELDSSGSTERRARVLSRGTGYCIVILAFFAAAPHFFVSDAM